MALDDSWELPVLESITVTEEELLLLDWVMCSGSGLIPNAPLEDLVTNWAFFRFDVWKGISDLHRQVKGVPTEINGVLTQELTIDEFTARALLAVTPTTFRWGTGVDCGYALKLKLYRFLSKEVEVDASIAENQTDSNSEDESTSSTGTST
jgi:hypothetical protein